MKFSQWALVAFASLVAADSNLTDQSRNILSSFSPPKHFRNVNLVRNINLEKSYPKETINVVIENIDKEAQSEYYIPFEPATAGKIGAIEARDKKESEKASFKVEIAGIDAKSSVEVYKITLPTPLAPKEQLTLSITFFVLSALQPLPAQIEQSDKQYVLHKFSAYAPSAYTTLKQKTKVKFATTDIPDAVVLPKSLNAEGKEDPQKQGTSFTYGPYGELEAGAVQEVSVRYEWTKPLTHAKLLERDVEISHWGGNIATEERLWLSNRAATLKNHFSRVTYQQTSYYNPPSSALKELRFPLTVGSVDAYFTDDIGNVSTSRFRANARESNLEIKPRYPLFGGWNYSFKVGWNGDLTKFLRNVAGKSDSFVLKVPFFEGPKQPEGVEYEQVVTRIVLPEGASNVHFETGFPIVSSTTGFHRSFMDTLGRTTLTLTAVNVVDELRDRELIITYDYPFSARFRKPFTIAAGLAVVFVISWIVGSLDVSIGKKQKQA